MGKMEFQWALLISVQCIELLIEEFSLYEEYQQHTKTSQLKKLIDLLLFNTRIIYRKKDTISIEN